MKFWIVTLALFLAAADQSAPIPLRMGGAAPLPPPETQTLVPADSLTTWAPGLDIPVRNTVCATINAAAYGDGAREASAGINAAIASCPVGQVLMLGAGTFRTDNRIALNKGITLRGSGVGVTVLQKYNNQEQEAVIQVAPSQFPTTDENTDVLLTADAVKGTFTATVADATGFAAGQFVKLDEDGYANSVWTITPKRMADPVPFALMTDRLWWPILCYPSSGQCAAGQPPRTFDNLPGSLPVPAGLSYHSRSGRPIAEIKEVTAVKGNVITFADPIHITYRTAYQAQLTRYTGTSVFVRDAGVEDLTLQGGADGNIQFLAAAYSWAKNIESHMSGNPGVDVKHGFRIEVRDSYLHDTVHPYPGGGGYLMSFQQGSSECLVENNVISGGNKMMVFRSAGAGSVVAYNYLDNGIIGNNTGWMEVGANASHMLGGHHVLFEGNRSFNYDSDNTWGGAIYMTIFRNHLTGTRRDYVENGNIRAAGLGVGSWWHNFIGNVLGLSGQMNGWIYEDPGDGTYGHATSVWGTRTKAVWRLGYNPGPWTTSPDVLTRTRAIRDGNFDYLTSAVNWDRTEQALPDSLYLAGKPPFFGAQDTWPWVEPLEATKLYTLPAHTRGEALLAAATVPGPPLGLVAARASATSATVDFLPPLESGGATITGYTATSSPGGLTGTANSTFGTITVSGLTEGQAYTFTVTATNRIGTSAASAASNAVTP